MIDWNRLIESARTAQANAYARFSNFKVGAALLASDGVVFTGCNVENSSYGLTMCAERTALFNAVSSGKRQFVALAVYTESTPPARPCGACRQALFEFCPEIEIACVNSEGAIDKFNLRNLLPEGFRL
jgi:cytidine deaminase